MSRWLGVDLDGCLAQSVRPFDPARIGEPVPAMLQRVRHWLDQGIEVRIFTARVAVPGVEHGGAGSPLARARAEATRQMIEDWCEHYLGERLLVTAQKDGNMVALFDDRAVAVESGTGRILGGSIRW